MYRVWVGEGPLTGTLGTPQTSLHSYEPHSIMDDDLVEAASWNPPTTPSCILAAQVLVGRGMPEPIGFVLLGGRREGVVGGLPGKGLMMLIPLLLGKSRVLFPSLRAHLSMYCPHFIAMTTGLRLSLLLDRYGMVLLCPEEKAILQQILRWAPLDLSKCSPLWLF